MSWIPYFHFVPAEDKFTPEWADKVINFYWYNSRLINLLQGKNVPEIEGYANGTYSVEPFKKIFRSLRKQQAAAKVSGIPQQDIDRMDKTGLQWERVPLIVPKLTAAIATIQNIPIEITCSCQDPLAQKNKQEDLDYLKARPKMQAALQPLYDSMNLGEVELEPTRHSSVPWTALPMQLDPNDEAEFKVFAELVYNLAPESAFESVLQQFYEFKKVSQVKMLEITDQLKFAASANRTFMDKNSGLPTIEYEYPQKIWTDGSALPDHSDNTIRVIDMWITPMELFKYFPNEIKDVEQLDKIVNFGATANSVQGNWGIGYAPCNNQSKVGENNFNTYKMNMKYVEIRSVDKMGIAQKPKSKFKYLSDDPKKTTSEVWDTNTYCFYWLQNTRWYFGQDRLDFSHLAKGKVPYNCFTSNIYKSKEKSAVELCIGENKKAQIADIKLQHTIIMSAPNGKIIDMKYIRNAAEGLTDDLKMSVDDILSMATESNVHLIDTEGFEGKQVGQYVPVKDLPGGLKDDILGYYRVIAEANQKISQYTGINDQLTGQATNPEGLIGLQKLMINASVNALRYVNEAVTSQYQNVFNTWGWYIQKSIKSGGKAKEAIINLIGTNKVNIIKGLELSPLHQIGIKISLGLREEERAIFKQEVQKMRQAGILNAADEYYIFNTPNPKDAIFLLAVKEIKFQKKQEEAAARQQQAMVQMKQQEGQNAIANTQVKSQGDIQQIRTQGETDAMLMQLGNQLGLSTKQIDGLIKAKLQDDRIDKQTEKSIKTIYANENAKQQTAIA